MLQIYMARSSESNTMHARYEATSARQDKVEGRSNLTIYPLKQYLETKSEFPDTCEPSSSLPHFLQVQCNPQIKVAKVPPSRGSYV